MSIQGSPQATRLHCRELRGQKTGIITISDETVELYYVGYDDFSQTSDREPEIVIVEDGRVASLYSNFSNHISQKRLAVDYSKYDLSDDKVKTRVINQNGILSNYAILGPGAWMPEDSAAYLSFQVSHSGRTLSHRDKMKGIRLLENASDENFILYRVEADEGNVTASYSATYRTDTGSVNKLHPVLAIEPNAPIALSDIGPTIFRYISFISFMCGGKISPKQVRIDRMSFQDKLASIAAGTYLGDYQFLAHWPAIEYNDSDLEYRGAPCVASDDGELEALKDALKVWLDRSAEWERAYAHMSNCLSMRGTISGERLLSAWRWFEDLPNASAHRGLSEEVVDRVIAAAVESASAQGLSSIDARIRGALGRLGEETLRERFTRLVVDIERRFGRLLPPDWILHLINARDFRGRVAHGHFIAKDEQDEHNFFKAILAMEALCFLLSAKDLPLSNAGVQRMRVNKFVSAYRNA